MARDGENDAFLSLGSNIDPERNLAAAVRLLRRYGDVLRVSSAWESPPDGFPDQPPFLNAALWLRTALSADRLKEEAIAAVELELGRLRTANRDGPRTIDVDIMLFNRDVLQLGRRRIPDPEILERPFVAIPLAEIIPGYRHPENGRTIRDIARSFDAAAAGMVRRDDVDISGSM